MSTVHEQGEGDAMRSLEQHIIQFAFAIQHERAADRPDYGSVKGVVVPVEQRMTAGRSPPTIPVNIRLPL